MDWADDAFARVRKAIPGAELSILGTPTAFLDRVIEAARSKGAQDAVHYPILPEIASCDLGVIPNHPNALMEINTLRRVFPRHSQAGRETGEQFWSPVQGHSLYFNWPIGHYPTFRHTDTLALGRVLVLDEPRTPNRPGEKSKKFYEFMELSVSHTTRAVDGDICLVVLFERAYTSTEQFHTLDPHN